MLPSREQLLAKADALPERPVAIEASWDGDSSGWYVCLTAILKTESGYRDSHLGAMQDGGDLRLFNGQVPPWGEAVLAREIGEELAARFGVPFYFPSPNHPEEDCPRWWEQDQGYLCRQCGILLLQQKRCRWRGVCYYCHLEEEREKKEAAWTPEERGGPRCHICGNPAKGTLASSPVCLNCLERYEDYQCSCCGVTVRILKTKQHTDVCSRCDLRVRLAQVSEVDRQAIRTAAMEGGTGAGLDAVRNLLGWSLYDAMSAVRELSRSAEPDATAEGGHANDGFS
jgi:hypothetical protein